VSTSEGPLGFEATPLTDSAALGDAASIRPLSDAVPFGMAPLTATSAGDAVLDLRVEPTVDLVVVPASEVPSLERPAERRGLLFAARWQLIAKRAMDVVGSSVLLLLLSPLLLLTAAAVLLTSRGPVLYVQQRIGRDGEPFRMLKFRSMRVDAHEGRHEVTHLNEARGPVFKVRRDPRITAVGRVIRKLSIDELPQLVNVLRGEMSLVGPRPPLPEEWAEYGPRERDRLAVAPGITCVWQVSGRSDLDFDTWVDMDLAYISEWTLRLDIRLLLLTIPAVVSGRGAY
jgi:lipopolysaccharide/colanic/teichoic acid biosynthesis glycosyltransferase